MSDEHKPDAERWWLDEQRNRDKVYTAVVVSFALSIGVSLVADLVPALAYTKHPYMAFEQLPFFAAAYGLVCCIGLVLAAAWLRTVLMRSEDYYDE